MKHQRFCFVLGCTALAPAAHAQFGSGIVFDPTQSAHALQQIEQGRSSIHDNLRASPTRQPESSPCTTSPTRCPSMPQNLEARYKADWSQWTNLPGPANTYGNTAALVNALNYGALVQAQQGYNSAYVQAQSYPSGSYSSLDSRTQTTVANQYATSELAQSTTTNTLATVGTIRSDSQAFASKLANLESDTFSTDPNQQTQNALLGKINSATYSRSIRSRTPTNSSWLRSSSSWSRRSSRSTPRTVPSTTRFTSSRTFPRPCRT